MNIPISMLHLLPGGLDGNIPVSTPAAAAGKIAQVAATGTANVPNTADGSSRAISPHGLTTVDTRVQVDIDKPSGRVIGRVIDKQTGELIRQVPPKELLRLLAKTREMLGALFDKKV